MQENVYAVPESSLAEGTQSARQEYYVVASTKFWVLFVCTFGYYSIYWHFKNWKTYKDFHKESMIPVMRAIFAIFFTHTLFNQIDSKVKAKSKEFCWSPDLWATASVLSVIAVRILDRLYGKDIIAEAVFALSIPLVLLNGVALHNAQLAININCDDPSGISNNHFTALNWLWIVLGSLVTLAVIAGIALAVIDPGV